ncbi:MAG: ATP-binding cassette domain-containing protein [Chitinophagales bacterium]
MIKAKNIYKSIGQNQILQDISLELSKGVINILFGPSGSGKTTLCRSLSLLDNPDKGELEIFENNYSFPNNLKKQVLPYPQIGFVYQQLFLWPHLTNKQNILLALGKKADEHINQFKELNQLLEIENVIDRYPNEISIGQKQRVAIARALILNPSFVFLDEITSALDIVQTKQIGNILLDLKAKGIGVLMITHNIEYFKEIADNFIFLSNGNIKEQGTKSIFTNPKSVELNKFLK